ncbi:MAG: TlpA disulfide reductase family protein, partial [Flavobacteriaceae bacterium]|nr:TlpA disulfide reductase family protein [Flavobacteriaceae bacterium]
MKLYSLFALIALIVLGCDEVKESNNQKLKVGAYRGVLDTQDNKQLPFIFEVVDEGIIKVYNAEEILEFDDIQYQNDSVYIRFSPFEGYISAKIENDSLKGSYIKESLDRVVPFQAKYQDSVRFSVTEPPQENVSGIWEVVFSPDNKEDEYPAKGIFKQEGALVSGTFRTNTGDYRYLEGVIDGDQLKLSAFDGAHAFLFTAEINDSIMNGTFYSGNHFQEPFIGKRNEDFELADPNNLTFLKEGYDFLEFSFPNLEGDTVSLNDNQFKDKVVVVQIMGSWCPNCLDESRFYSDYYLNADREDLEFVALAFEYAKTKEKALEGLRRL